MRLPSWLPRIKNIEEEEKEDFRQISSLHDPTLLSLAGQVPPSYPSIHCTAVTWQVEDWWLFNASAAPESQAKSL